MAFAGLSTARVLPSVHAYARNAAALADSYERITTGIRIIRAGDDASSVSEATRLQAQSTNLRGTLTTGARATSFLQVAQDGLSQIKTILESLSALTTEANSSGQTKLTYAYLDAQFQSQKSSIDAVVAATRFNNASILDGSAAGSGAFQAQVGEKSGGSITIAIQSVTSASLFPAPVSLSNAAAATSATGSVTTAQATVADALAKVAAYQVRLDTADATVKRALNGLGNGIDGLIKTDSTPENQHIDLSSLHQEVAAAVLAQASRFNSNLLGLVG